WVDRRLTAAISYVLRRYTDLPTRDVASLLDLSGDYAVSELAVKPADWVAGRSLADLALRDEGIVVLALRRADGRHLPTPTGRTVVAAGDILTVYGRGELLRELDDRPAGPDGDLAHRAAVARQERLERAQHNNAAAQRDTA
ncbi:MAG: TrkA C-terminal domain-containing protein, partial [Actinobacteria bacterium]|nr:TrkA C-terminal domain-containing protein [Actinomycetota bacterium]